MEYFAFSCTGMRPENDLTNRKGQAGAVVLILILHVDELGFNFPLQTTVIVPKSHLVSISNSDAETWKSKCHFSYPKTHLNARYEKDLQQPHILLVWCYSLGLRALGHPKLLWMFTFRECIWLSWDIRMSNFQCVSYENQISCTEIRERNVPGALWFTLWRYLYLCTLYGFLSLNIHTNCVWTSSSVPPFWESQHFHTSFWSCKARCKSDAHSLWHQGYQTSQEQTRQSLESYRWPSLHEWTSICTMHREEAWLTLDLMSSYQLGN